MPKRKTHEQFVKEIYDKYGDEYEVLSKYIHSKQKVKIKHNKCQRVYEVIPNSILRGTRCSYCYRPVRKTTEQFKNEVKEQVGNEYSVIGEYKNNGEKILMIHNVCKRQYAVSPGHFLNSKRRCPYCNGGSPQSKNIFTEKFDNVSNGNYQLLSSYTKNKNKIKVKHLLCGTVYEVRADNFLSGKGCPFCKQSKGERIIYDILNNNNINFITQKRFKDCKNIKPLPFDFAVLNNKNEVQFLIEYQGVQHFRLVEHFGGVKGYKKTQENDKVKYNYCLENNIKLYYIRFDEDVVQKTNDIIYEHVNHEPS